MSPEPVPPATVAFLDQLRNLPQHLLPQRLLTRICHRLTRVRTPWFKNLLIRQFIEHFQVDMSEALEPDPSRYADFNHFFTRALRRDVRPLAGGDRDLCCPVDGAVSQLGSIQDGRLFQAKGKSFSLLTLLGGDEARAHPFSGGSFATLYLSPRDYHRIHMPLLGVLREMVHIPGRLFSVSPLTTRMVPDLFGRNERVAAVFATPAGPMAMVMVGAINVASIETVWSGTVTPPLGTRIERWVYPETGAGSVHLEKGEEMGRFNMGSTVIVLFAAGAVRWDAAIAADVRVRMGQKLGEFAKAH